MITNKLLSCANDASCANIESMPADGIRRLSLMVIFGGQFRAVNYCASKSKSETNKLREITFSCLVNRLRVINGEKQSQAARSRP